MKGIVNTVFGFVVYIKNYVNICTKNMRTMLSQCLTFMCVGLNGSPCHSYRLAVKFANTLGHNVKTLLEIILSSSNQYQTRQGLSEILVMD